MPVPQAVGHWALASAVWPTAMAVAVPPTPKTTWAAGVIAMTYGVHAVILAVDAAGAPQKVADVTGARRMPPALGSSAEARSGRTTACASW